MSKKIKPEESKAKIRSLIYRFKHDFFNFENVIFAVAIILCISWTWRAISSMSRNWELEQRVNSRSKERTLLQLEVENLELENQYLKSEEYQELAARRLQNKKRSGETMVYLPPNSEEAINKYPEEVEKPEPTTPNNFEQWMSFLFGA